MTSLNNSSEPPFAAEGGIETSHVAEEIDPYRALDELMVVIEALCPSWPPREVFTTSGQMLL